MSNNTSFDPFGLQQSGSDGSGKVRPVLIAVSQGNSDQPGESEQWAQNMLHRHQLQQQQQQQEQQRAATTAEEIPLIGVSKSESFDPFGIGALLDEQQRREADAGSASCPDSPPEVSRITRAGVSIVSRGSAALPPKLLVKLTIYEEASSAAIPGADAEGASDVAVEGSIYAQVQCSDATRNAPFALLSSPSFSEGSLNVRPNTKFSLSTPSPTVHIVSIPKEEIGYVPVAYYSLQQKVHRMPILLQRKVTIHENSCRVAIQVRSKLTNLGDMEDFTIALAIPERVDGDSVEIVRGNGTWDALKRTIKWSLASLNKGESFMVSAQAKLWSPFPEGEEVVFPVLLRCKSSADRISTAEFIAAQADGHPSSVTCNRAHSFRLLHRLT